MRNTEMFAKGQIFGRKNTSYFLIESESVRKMEKGKWEAKTYTSSDSRWERMVLS